MSHTQKKQQKIQKSLSSTQLRESKPPSQAALSKMPRQTLVTVSTVKVAPSAPRAEKPKVLGNGIVVPDSTTVVKPVGFSKPEMSTNVTPPQGSATPEMVADSQKSEYAYGLLEPYSAMASGIFPKVPDPMSTTATATFGSQNVISGTSVANTSTASSDALIVSAPWGWDYSTATFQTATNPGAPSTQNVVADPVISTFGSQFLAFRMVACQQLVRNPTPVTSMAGMGVQGNSQAQSLVLYNTAAATPDITLPTTFAKLRASGLHFTRVFNNPGDIGAPVWFPHGRLDIGAALSTYDWFGAGASIDNIWLYGAEIGNWAQGGAGGHYDPAQAFAQSTVVFSWLQMPAATANQYDVQIVRLWEVIPLPTVAQIVQPTMSLASVDESRLLMMKALQRLPMNAIARNVWRDDGTSPGLVSDIKTIWGAGKRVYTGIKDLLGQGMSAITSLFEAKQQLVNSIQRYLALSDEKSVSDIERKVLLSMVSRLYGETCEELPHSVWSIGATRKTRVLVEEIDDSASVYSVASAAKVKLK